MQDMEAPEKKSRNFGKVSLGASVSSLIDLKAELLRKREALKAEKLKQPAQKEVYVKQKLSFANQPLHAEKGPPKTTPVPEQFPEEDADLQKSRAALERKAKLYDKLSSGQVIPDDEENEHYMVNFQRKAVDTIIEERENKELRDAPTVPTREQVAKQKEEDEDRNLPRAEYEKIDEGLAGTEDEWIDYTDALGRSRRCMRKDLPILIKNDRELTGKTGIVETDKPERTAQFLSHERMREELRQKWEEQEAENAFKESIHYGDVRFQEAREHGVGFYDLSGDAAERQKQLDLLNKLREQTEKQKAISNSMKEKRKAMLEARLARIRQRKNIQTEGEEKKESSDEESGDEDKKKEEEVSVLPQGAAEEAKDSRVFEVPEMRPWDQGKNLAQMVNEPRFRKKKLTQEDWIEMQRQEREGEFAPPSAYSTGAKQPKYSNFTRGGEEFGHTPVGSQPYSAGAPEPSYTPKLSFEDLITQRLAEVRKLSEQQQQSFAGPF